MGWLLRSHVPCESKNHLLVTIQRKWMLPCKYLGTFKKLDIGIRVREGTGTSITTIANEYTSDCSVGRTDSTLSRSVASIESERSSGAFQRIVPPPLSVEALNEMFFVTEESPKSVRRGLRLESIRMLFCVSKLAGGKETGKIKYLRS